MHENFNRNLVKAPFQPFFYAVILFFMMIIFIFILVQGRYGKQEIVKGLIRNESFFRVSSNKAGNVSAIYVSEGDNVVKGAPLFRLSLPSQDATDNQSGKSLIQESIARLLDTRQELQNEELLLAAEIDTQKKQQVLYFDSVEKSIGKLGGIQKNHQKKKAYLTRQLNDYEQLLKDKSINKTEVETLRYYIIDNNVAIDKLAIEIEGIEQNKAEKTLYFARVLRELQQTQNNVARKQREVSNELNKIQMQHDYVVTAPVDGIIHDVGILKGDYVDGNSPSMIVRAGDSADPIAILYLSSNQIGLIDPSEKVFLRVDTFPYENYGVIAAKVVNVSQTPTKISLDDKESRFRVKLQFDNADKHSQIPLAMLNDGMSVTASLRQPQQTLFEWLFLPVKKTFQRNPDVRL